MEQRTFLKNFVLLVFCLHVFLCENVESSRTGVTDNCELPYGFWELNRGPLEEQPVRFNHCTTSLAPRELFFFFFYHFPTTQIYASQIS